MELSFADAKAHRGLARFHGLAMNAAAVRSFDRGEVTEIETTLPDGTIPLWQSSTRLVLVTSEGCRPCELQKQVIPADVQYRTFDVVMTQSHKRHATSENPYSDRIEGDVLVYTAAGKAGDQVLSGVNQRIPQQAEHRYPIYCFSRVTSRRESRGNPRQWEFVGLLQYLRYFPSKQIDVRGKLRSVWQFDLRVHRVEVPIFPNDDRVVGESVLAEATDDDDREIADSDDGSIDPAIVETERKRLLELHPEEFEKTVRDVVAASGFRDVCVTKYSNDGGIDITAFAGTTMWPLGNLQLQVQAKRWLHAVGRPDIANLRGSLAPFASGAVVTTGHFSKAAIRESEEPGKRPIVLINGYQFATLTKKVLA